MGADFVGVFVPVSRNETEALDRLHAMTDSEIIEALQQTNLAWEYDEGDLYVFDDEQVKPTGINRTAMMEVLEEYVKLTYRILRNEERYASWFRQDDATFVLAGGLSWGDAPEFVSELEIVVDLGVTYDKSKKLAWVDKS